MMVLGAFGASTQAPELPFGTGIGVEVPRGRGGLTEAACVWYRTQHFLGRFCVALV